MKAIRVYKPGGPEELNLEEIAKPSPAEGELLVRLEAIGVNFTDVQLRRGNHNVPMPVIPGREGAGTVEALGAGVTGFAVGDRVAYAPVQPPWLALVSKVSSWIGPINKSSSMSSPL